MNTSGIINTIAGNGNCGFSGDGGSAMLAMLCTPEGVAVDATGNVYVGDYSNARIRKLNRAGKINTIAGTGLGGYNGDNLPAASTNIGGPVTPSIDLLGTFIFLMTMPTGYAKFTEGRFGLS